MLFLRQTNHQLHRIDAMTDPDHVITAAPLPPAPPPGANDAQRPNASGVTFGIDQNHLAAGLDLVITPPSHHVRINVARGMTKTRTKAIVGGEGVRRGGGRCATDRTPRARGADCDRRVVCATVGSTMTMSIAMIFRRRRRICRVAIAIR
jgi:hypothetical protein